MKNKTYNLELDRDWFKVGDVLTDEAGNKVYILGIQEPPTRKWWQKVLCFLTLGFFFKKIKSTSFVYRTEILQGWYVG